jgi:hypothetical protein
MPIFAARLLKTDSYFRAYFAASAAAFSSASRAFQTLRADAYQIRTVFQGALSFFSFRDLSRKGMLSPSNVLFGIHAATDTSAERFRQGLYRTLGQCHRVD